MAENTMTEDDAALVAVRKMGAPADISDFQWYNASLHGETFRRVQIADGGLCITLDHSDTTTYGTLRVGWNSAHRLAAFCWEPTE